MTKEQLDAIRARVEAATPGPWDAGRAYCCPDMGWIDGPKRMVCPVHESMKRTHTLDANDAAFIASAREDVPALLAEVEGMRESCTGLVKQNERQYDEVLRLTTEVERLKADPLPAAAWVREVERAAFARGVAAMREAAASHFSVVAPYDYIAPRIRALPDPEDKS